MIVKRSASDYAKTVDALLAAIEQRGLAVFARIDHAAGAREVGMELADEEVVLFGNPRGGTPLHAFVPASKISVFGGLSRRA